MSFKRTSSNSPIQDGVGNFLLPIEAVIVTQSRDDSTAAASRHFPSRDEQQSRVLHSAFRSKSDRSPSTAGGYLKAEPPWPVQYSGDQLVARSPEEVHFIDGKHLTNVADRAQTTMILAQMSSLERQLEYERGEKELALKQAELLRSDLRRNLTAAHPSDEATHEYDYIDFIQDKNVPCRLGDNTKDLREPVSSGAPSRDTKDYNYVEFVRPDDKTRQDFEKMRTERDTLTLRLRDFVLTNAELHEELEHVKRLLKDREETSAVIKQLHHDKQELQKEVDTLVKLQKILQQQLELPSELGNQATTGQTYTDETSVSVREELKQAIQFALEQQRELQKLQETIRQQNQAMKELSRRLDAKEPGTREHNMTKRTGSDTDLLNRGSTSSSAKNSNTGNTAHDATVNANLYDNIVKRSSDHALKHSQMTTVTDKNKEIYPINWLRRSEREEKSAPSNVVKQNIPVAVTHISKCDDVDGVKEICLLRSRSDAGQRPTQSTLSAVRTSSLSGAAEVTLSKVPRSVGTQANSAAASSHSSYIYVNITDDPLTSTAIDMSIDQIRICPMCSKIFPGSVPQAEFARHVDECVSEDGGATMVNDRRCPICNGPFPVSCSQEVFERHVQSHFDEEPIADQFEQL